MCNLICFLNPISTTTKKKFKNNDKQIKSSDEWFKGFQKKTEMLVDWL